MKSKLPPDPKQAAIAIETWHAMNPGGSKVAAVECLQNKKGKPAVWNLKLQSGPVRSVVAKRASLAEARLEDCVYRDILPGLQLPAPAYFGMAPAADEATAWIFVEYVEGDHYSPDHADHRRLASEWLGDLHSALAGDRAPVPLEHVGPNHYRRMLASLVCTLPEVRENPVIGNAGRQALDRLQHLLFTFTEAWDHIEQLAADFEQTLVHGSFGPRNMRVCSMASGPALLVFDWGAAGWGIPARDVAKLASGAIAGDPGIYCTRRGLNGNSGPRLVALGTLFRSVEHLHWMVPALAYKWVDGPLETVGKHAAQLQALADSRALDPNR